MRSKGLICVAAAVLLRLPLMGRQQVVRSPQVKQLAKASAVINEIMGTPDRAIPQELLDRAVCVGIVPSQLKFAIGFGGTYGRGVLICRRGGNGPWGAPSMFKLGGASLGFQIGGTATDVVFMVMNPEGAQKLLQSGVSLGADASAAAGPVGRTAKAATDIQLHAQILSYSRSRGLFAGVSLAGAVLNHDDNGNAHLYGHEVDAKHTLLEGDGLIPGAARHLISTLTNYSPHGGQPLSPIVE